MEKQVKLQKKREQRHRRESNEKLDKMISDFVRYKYPGIYAEAKEYHDELDAIYPSKRNLIKTVEHTAWVKKVQEQKVSNNKQMDLKIQLMRCKKNTNEAKKKNPTVVNESRPPGNEIPSTGLNENTPPGNEIPSTGLNENTPPGNEIPSTGLNENTPPGNEIPSTGLNENTPPGNEIPSTGLNENTPPGNEIPSTGLDEITPSLSAEISPQMVQDIIDELRGDKDFNEQYLNMFPEDVEMVDYVLEEGELY